jgi:hypothetical protein
MFLDVSYHTQNEDTIVILGDLNARIGWFQNELTNIEANESGNRQSKDKITNKRGRALIEKIIDLDLQVLNGSTYSDRCGEATYMNSNGCSVIDLCLVSRTKSDIFKDFQVLNSLESDHFPVLLTVSPRIQAEVKGSCQKITRIVWNSEASEIFKNTMNENYDENETETIEEIVALIYRTAKDCNLVKTIELNGRQSEYSPKWYNAECKKMRKACNDKLRKVRNENRSSKTNSLNTEKEFIESKRIFKKKTRECRNIFNLEIQEMLHPRDFYNAVGLFRNKGKNQSRKCEVPVETFEDFFMNVF